MEIKIDENGYLKIKRAGLYAIQYCPHGREQERCGDWCPLFHEPNIPPGEEMGWLQICAPKAFYEQITDEREIKQDD